MLMTGFLVGVLVCAPITAGALYLAYKRGLLNDRLLALVKKYQEVIDHKSGTIEIQAKTNKRLQDAANKLLTDRMKSPSNARH
jgi:hypothetical protein